MDKPSFNVRKHVLARQSRHVNDLYRAYKRRVFGEQKMRQEYKAMGIR